METSSAPVFGYNGEGIAPYGRIPFSNSSEMGKKRRRLDGDDHGAESSWSSQSPQQQQQDASQGQLTAHQQLPVPTVAAAVMDYSVVPQEGVGAISDLAVNEGSRSTLGHWPASGTSPYPDVSSYQQPYFYQHTDPSTYTSPWPPLENSSSFATTSPSTYPPAAQSEGMPYFPPQNAVAEQTDGFDAAAAAVRLYQSFPEPDLGSIYPYPNTSAPSGSEPRRNPAIYPDDASMHLKIQSLPILDNLATQLIHTIAKISFPQIQDLTQGNDTEESQAYITLKNLFDQTRKVYSRETPFIDAIAIQMFQPNQQEIIRKANIATFISSILGAHDVSFFHLNEFFMETFVPLGHRLLKWQGAIYLELKTQTYISALMNSDGSPKAMLDELFPSDLDSQILTRHPDAPSLSPSEQDFVDRSRSRKNYLLAEVSLEEALHELPKKYQWNDFVREFASCVNKNVDGIMNVPVRSHPVVGGTSHDKRNPNATHDSANPRSGQKSISGPATNKASSTAATQPQPSFTQPEKRSSVANSTIRQQWSKQEEDALLEGLGKVNGPHWSQILALYGRGGSISEILKDRNQVQLKDKARNLKLGYLKIGKEVPIALRGVTGELRKRGGARARAALELLDAEEQQGSGLEGDAGDDTNQESERGSAGKQAKGKSKGMRR